MIYSRFAKNLVMVRKNKRPALRCLYNIVKDDVQTTTNSNIAQDLLIIPRHVIHVVLEQY